MSILILTALSSHLAAVCFFYVAAPYSWIVGGLFEAFALFTLFLKPSSKRPAKMHEVDSRRLLPRLAHHRGYWLRENPQWDHSASLRGFQ